MLFLRRFEIFVYKLVMIRTAMYKRKRLSTDSLSRQTAFSGTFSPMLSLRATSYPLTAPIVRPEMKYRWKNG